MKNTNTILLLSLLVLVIAGFVFRQYKMDQLSKRLDKIEATLVK